MTNFTIDSPTPQKKGEGEGDDDSDDVVSIAAGGWNIFIRSDVGRHRIFSLFCNKTEMR